MLNQQLRKSYDNGAFVFENYVNANGQPIALSRGHLFNKTYEYNRQEKTYTEHIYVYHLDGGGHCLRMNVFENDDQYVELCMFDPHRVVVEYNTHECDDEYSYDYTVEEKTQFELYKDEAEFFQYSVSTDDKLFFTYEEQREIIRFYEKMVAFADLKRMQREIK